MKHVLLALACLALPTAAMAEGDPVRGEKLFRRCVACHAIIKDDKMLVKGGITGPNLYGVINRVAGTEYDYLNGSPRLPVPMFTDDMIKAGEMGLVWTEENLAAYVEDPIGFLRSYLGDIKARPNMGIALKDGGADVAAYLVQFAD